MHSYIDLLREPDLVLFQYEDSCVRWEEPDSREEQTAKLEYTVKEGEAIITLYPSARPYSRVKLRFRGDLSDARLVMGDTFERYCGGAMWDAKWTAPLAERPLPWYFHLHDGEALHSFGVKTGPNVFCTFNCDEGGITLWLDVRSGGRAARLAEPLEACRVVCRRGTPGEHPFFAAQAFCRMMCEKPNLAKEPIFGVNNWYWAYGQIDFETVMRETAYLAEMTVDAVCRPHMIIDDGWQVAHRAGYNGGPWNATNDGFPELYEVSARIREGGARPGIWFRPLLDTAGPDEAKSPVAFHTEGFQLDPSHPYTLEKVANDVRSLVGAGFELLKYDFSVIDTLRSGVGADGMRAFYDVTKPSCYILRNFYSTIEAASGSANILSCNVVNHLAAGLHAAQRAGDDTSGRNFEQTRLCGVGSLTRLAQNNTFFALDPDCAAFTDMVAHGINLDFLEAAAISGAVTIASVTPGCLTSDEMARIRKIYKIASCGGLGAYPRRFVGENSPAHFLCPDGTTYDYDWYSYYDGRRQYWTWRS
ncbi:MAG: hypothetical protein J6T24_08335 [Clostridia bacterium]|nr:hypothetical protein [Clostridia bacterium]